MDCRRSRRARGGRLRVPAWTGCGRCTATRSSAVGWRAGGRCSASASACRSCSSTGSSTASRPRAAASGRARWSGCRRPSYRTWGGTPSRSPPGRRLFAGIEDERFYFVHSYGVRDWTLVTNNRTRAPLRAPGPSTAATGSSRRSRTGRSCATQFHPEKSGDAGARLLRNWVDGLRSAGDAEMSKERARRREERGARGRRSSRRPAPRGREAGANGPGPQAGPDAAGCPDGRSAGRPASSPSAAAPGCGC